MFSADNPENVLALAASVGPFLLAWWLAGPEARRNLVAVDLFLAGLAGAAIGFFGAFVPGFIYSLGVFDGLLPVPSLRSDHTDLMLIYVVGGLALGAAWLGFLSGLAHELQELGRRRAAAAVLVSPLIICVLGTGIVAALVTFGSSEPLSFRGMSAVGVLPLLAGLAGVWLLAASHRLRSAR